MTLTNAVQKRHEETIRKLEQELQQEQDMRKRDVEQERQQRRQERMEPEANVISKLRMKDALIDSLASRMERIEKLQSAYCTIQSNKDPAGVGPLATLTAEFSTYMKENVELEATIERLRFKHDALSKSTQDVQRFLNGLSTTVQNSGHAMSLGVEKIRVGSVEMKEKIHGVDFKLCNTTRGTEEDTSPYVEPAVPLVVQDLQLQVRNIREECEELGKQISEMQLSIDANRNAITRISKPEMSSAGTPRLPSHHSPRQGDKGPWEKTLIFGAIPEESIPPSLCADFFDMSAPKSIDSMNRREQPKSELQGMSAQYSLPGGTFSSCSPPHDIPVSTAPKKYQQSGSYGNVHNDSLRGNMNTTNHDVYAPLKSDCVYPGDIHTDRVHKSAAGATGSHTIQIKPSLDETSEMEFRDQPTHDGRPPRGQDGEWRHCRGLDLRYFDSTTGSFNAFAPL